MGYFRSYDSGHRVVAFTAEGMAPAKPPDPQPTALQHSVFQNRFLGVVGAGGGITAGGRQVGRDGPLVKPNGPEHGAFQLRVSGWQDSLTGPEPVGSEFASTEPAVSDIEGPSF